MTHEILHLQCTVSVLTINTYSWCFIINTEFIICLKFSLKYFCVGKHFYSSYSSKTYKIIKPYVSSSFVSCLRRIHVDFFWSLLCFYFSASAFFLSALILQISSFFALSLLSFGFDSLNFFFFRPQPFFNLLCPDLSEFSFFLPRRFLTVCFSWQYHIKWR